MAKAGVKEKPGSETSEKLVDPRRKAVRVQVGPLLNALKDVASVTSRDAVPILANVLFESGGGSGAFGVRLTATNLDISATRDLGADFGDAEARDYSGFITTLPAKPLIAVLTELDSEATILIEMPAAHNPLSGQAFRAELTCGRLTFKLPVLPPADFPLVTAFEVAAQFEIAPSVLADALAAVHHAISTEETRYYLNGVYLHPCQAQGEALFLRLATTDGHRLARLTMDAPDGSASFASVIIPKATVALLEKLLTAVCKLDAPDPVVIDSDGKNKGRLRFVVGDTEILSKTIDGDFPDYTRVIPTSSLHTALVDRAALTGAIRRVAALASKDSRAIKAVFSTGQIELSMHSPENGEASEQLPCSFDGDEIRIGFNSKFWLDALGALASDEVEMGLSDPSAPVTLRPAIDGERFVQVLMPMAI